MGFEKVCGGGKSHPAATERNSDVNLKSHDSSDHGICALVRHHSTKYRLRDTIPFTPSRLRMGGFPAVLRYPNLLTATHTDAPPTQHDVSMHITKTWLPENSEKLGCGIGDYYDCGHLPLVPAATGGYCGTSWPGHRRGTGCTPPGIRTELPGACAESGGGAGRLKELSPHRLQAIRSPQEVEPKAEPENSKGPRAARDYVGRIGGTETFRKAVTNPRPSSRRKARNTETLDRELGPQNPGLSAYTAPHHPRAT